MKIASLHHNGQYWQATVTVPDPPDGRTCELDRKHGSWDVVDGTHRRFALPAVAAELQAHVRKLERREARLGHSPA